jgi:EAL domain-containing protein (putative c-di-GMP-specific phosphodiesterase class I)/DNA-binding NarL/FixJ family response regulator
MRLLVFDDDPDLARLVMTAAARAGLDATAVSDAVSFRQALQDQQPPIIVLDLQLGATDGVEQLRLLAERRYAGTLILTSERGGRVLSTVQALGRSLGLKIEGALEKPLDAPALQHLLARLQSMPEDLSAETLRAAIANDEMSLDFQPIVAAGTKAFRKLEALLRWEHPQAGLIPPRTFLAIAERDPVTIEALAEWVVGAAVDAYQVLVELGVVVPIAVNISAQNLRDRTLPDRLEQRLRAGGMPPGHLCLEVSETAAFTDAMLSMDILSRLQLKGICLSIDNFGTGYSSLKLLQQMPFSEIKIDRSFISDLAASRDSRAIVKSIIDLAANMEMGCVAEGVETQETADLLGRLGACDLQGFLIGRPMPIEAVPIWLKIWSRYETSAAQAQPDGSGHEMEGGRRPRDPAKRSFPDIEADAVRLSPRQLDVMRLLSQGHSVKEIARRLNLGIGTVKVHLSLAYSALGVHNRVQAVRRAGPMLDRCGKEVRNDDLVHPGD